MTRTWMVVAVAAAVWLTAGSTANAGLLPVSHTVSPESGNFRWTYSIVLPTDVQLRNGDYFTFLGVDLHAHDVGTGIGAAERPEGIVEVGHFDDAVHVAQRQ